MISAIPRRILSLSSALDCTRICLRNVCAIFPKNVSARLSQEPCLGVKPKTFLHVLNGQEKAELYPPRRQDAGRPPNALKISHNPIQHPGGDGQAPWLSRPTRPGTVAVRTLSTASHFRNRDRERSGTLYYYSPNCSQAANNFPSPCNRAVSIVNLPSSILGCGLFLRSLRSFAVIPRLRLCRLCRAVVSVLTRTLAAVACQGTEKN